MKTGTNIKMRGATSKNLPRPNSLPFSFTKSIRVSFPPSCLRVTTNLTVGSAVTCPTTVRHVVENFCHHRRSCWENQTTQPIIVMSLCPRHSRAPPTMSRAFVSINLLHHFSRLTSETKALPLLYVRF